MLLPWETLANRYHRLLSKNSSFTPKLDKRLIDLRSTGWENIALSLTKASGEPFTLPQCSLRWTRFRTKLTRQATMRLKTDPTYEPVEGCKALLDCFHCGVRGMHFDVDDICLGYSLRSVVLHRTCIMTAQVGADGIMRDPGVNFVRARCKTGFAIPSVDGVYSTSEAQRMRSLIARKFLRYQRTEITLLRFLLLTSSNRESLQASAHLC